MCSKVSGSFPPLSILNNWDDSEVDWTEMCIEMENEKNKWCNVDTAMRYFVVKDVHYASVDAIVLVNVSCNLNFFMKFTFERELQLILCLKELLFK